jgi:hypothetical protein
MVTTNSTVIAIARCGRVISKREHHRLFDQLVLSMRKGMASRTPICKTERTETLVVTVLAAAGRTAARAAVRSAVQAVAQAADETARTLGQAAGEAAQTTAVRVSAA